MKRHTGWLILPLLVLATASFAAENRTWHDRYFDKEWVFTPHSDEVLVLYRAEASEADRQAVVQTEGLSLRHEYNDLYRTAVYRIPSGDDVESAAVRLTGRSEIEAAAPAVVDQEGYTKYYIPHQLTVQFEKSLPDPACRERIRAAGSEVLEDYWTPGYYRITTPSGRDVFQALRDWYREADILFAEPAYMCYDDAVHVPNDPYFPDQWSLRNTGQQPGWTPGADVQAVDAWDISRGNPNVLVVIIDTGMDLSHPDLIPNLLPREGADWDFADPDTSPDDEGDHGTCCSGIAVAVQDNDIGVSGIAPMCRIMPLRVDLASGANANRADAINYAASRRAEFDGLVMSNSWIMSSGDFTAVQAAVENAHALDCVVCFASGNDNGAIRYPAKYPETIAVGATSPCDERKSPSSCDGESWGSNYGPELDVVAPGVKIYTTDRLGGAGYSSGDYFASFNGTSSACPLAAGLCALIYSVNPSLSNEEVRQVLRETAEDQVGPPNEDTPGWDPYMGWGRINAYQALLAAATGYGQLAGNVGNASFGGVPIEGATVVVEEADRSDETDADGNYLFNLPPGTYTVTASHPSFSPATVEGVEVVADEITVQDFSLTDIAGPTITDVTSSAATPDTTGPYEIQATVRDFSSVAWVKLFYRANGGSWTELPMTGTLDTYAAEIPGWPAGTRIDYYIEAQDGIGLTSVEPPGAPGDFFSLYITETDYAYECEDPGDPNWQLGMVGDTATSGIWIRDDPVGTVYNGQQIQPEDDHTPDPGVKCFVTGNGTPGGAAGDNDVDGGCTSLRSPIFDLSGAERAFVSYWRWYAMGGNSADDEFAVDVSSDGGGSWVALERVPNNDNVWRQVVLDLTPYIALTDQVVFRFQACDLGTAGLVEAAIDDFSIDLFNSPSSGVDWAGEALTDPGLRQNAPNPFSPAAAPVTTITFSLSGSTPARLTIHDAQGRLVRTLADGPLGPGIHHIGWDGLSDRGEEVGSGVYFYRLDDGAQEQSRRLIVIR